MIDTIASKKVASEPFTIMMSKVVLNGHEYTPDDKSAYLAAKKAAIADGNYGGYDTSTTAAKKLMYSHELIMNGTDPNKAAQMADQRFGVPVYASKQALQSGQWQAEQTESKTAAKSQDTEQPAKAKSTFKPWFKKAS